MVDNKIIGSRLEQLRKEKNETQMDVANVLNVQRQIVSYYETGRRTPNVEDLMILAGHYNTTVDYLLGRTDTKTVDEDIQMICDYTGLNESAVNCLHSLVHNPISPLDLGVLNELISPSIKLEKCLSLPHLTLLLYEFECRYKTLVDKKKAFKESISTLPIEDVVKETSHFDDKEKLAKMYYYDFVEGIKRLTDNYVESHIKTPERCGIEADYSKAVSIRYREMLKKLKNKTPSSEGLSVRGGDLCIEFIFDNIENSLD